jgi:hypothetical protein
MKRHIAGIAWIFASVGLTGCAAEGGRPSLATKYGPANIFGGYSDKLVEPGVWRVEARTNGVSEDGLANAIAAFRAAEIMRREGFEYIQIIDQKGHKKFVGLRGGTESSAGQDLTLWIRGSHDRKPTAECRAKLTDACFTLTVTETLSRYGPLFTSAGGTR